MKALADCLSPSALPVSNRGLALVHRLVSAAPVAFCLILTACATAPIASAPTPVACAPKDSPTVPATTQNAELAKLDDYKLVITIAAERLSLIDYAGKADAVIQACK